MTATIDVAKLSDNWRDGEPFLYVVPGDLDHDDHPWPPCENDLGCYAVPSPEWVEAATVCPTCNGDVVLPHGSIHPKAWGGQPAPCNTICPDCHGGKRLVLITGKCDHPHHDTLRADGGWSICIPGACRNGTVTLGHAVIDHGPHPFYAFDAVAAVRPCFVAFPALGGYVLTGAGPRADGEPEFIPDLPPDTDPASLVGQFAVICRSVTPHTGPFDVTVQP